MKRYFWAICASLIFSSSAYAQDVSKDKWIAVMKTALPTAFCSSAQYFRQCFQVSAAECEEVVASATRVCLNNLSDQIPVVLHQPQDGSAWGRKVGECAGESYELALLKKRISNDQCNDVKNWQ